MIASAFAVGLYSMYCLLAVIFQDNPPNAGHAGYDAIADIIRASDHPLVPLRAVRVSHKLREVTG